MFTPAQRAAFAKALAAADKMQPVLDRLREMAKYSPLAAERLRELQARADYIRGVSEAGIGIEANGAK